MANERISINRAPVLTLWAAVVAERLGILERPKERPLRVERKSAKPKQEIVALMGRLVHTVKTSEGVRAATKGEVIDPRSVEKYLSQKFGDDLSDVKEAMQDLAKATKPEKLAVDAYKTYEKFRPNVPAGEKGWGAKGELDLKLLRMLTK